MQRTPTRSISLRYAGAVLGTLIVLLGIVDVVSTNMVLAAGGVELNPIVAWIMEQLDHWWHLPKLLVHVVAGFLVYHLLNSRFTATVALLLVFLYGVVVHHNLSLLF
ncbi:MAG: DUF5658 family protein [Alphaproteobacteria bacterium]|nr:DUF5658 family protein [Alphaproteobacteria bacterium]